MLRRERETENIRAMKRDEGRQGWMEGGREGSEGERPKVKGDGKGHREGRNQRMRRRERRAKSKAKEGERRQTVMERRGEDSEAY